MPVAAIWSAARIAALDFSFDCGMPKTQKSTQNGDPRRTLKRLRALQRNQERR
jgi:hypothetical protein